MCESTQYVSELMLISWHISTGLNHVPHHNATPPMLPLYRGSTVCTKNEVSISIEVHREDHEFQSQRNNVMQTECLV